jgi:hypothetical protein
MHAVDDDGAVVRGQKLDGHEAGHGRFGQVGLGIVQQLVDATREPEAGGVVGENRVPEAKDQGLRR